ERKMARRLAVTRLVRGTSDVEDVDDEESHRQSDRHGPDPRLDVHATSGALADAAHGARACGRRSYPPVRAGSPGPSPASRDGKAGKGLPPSSPAQSRRQGAHVKSVPPKATLAPWRTY